MTKAELRAALEQLGDDDTDVHIAITTAEGSWRILEIAEVALDRQGGSRAALTDGIRLRSALLNADILAARPVRQRKVR